MLSVYIFRVQNDNEILLIYSLITREREIVHMEERSHFRSIHFNEHFAIAGHNIHRRAAEKPKIRWFIYLEEDMACG